jgi:hypothetical protein
MRACRWRRAGSGASRARHQADRGHARRTSHLGSAPSASGGGHLLRRAHPDGGRPGWRRGRICPRVPFLGHLRIDGHLLAGAALHRLLGALGIAIYQWILISRTGQSLGKKWTGIRIERIDGSPYHLRNRRGLRNWVPKVMGPRFPTWACSSIWSIASSSFAKTAVACTITSPAPASCDTSGKPCSSTTPSKWKRRSTCASAFTRPVPPAAPGPT